MQFSNIRSYTSLFKHFLLNLYELKGDFQGEPFKLVVADDGTTLDYISSLVFPQGVNVSRTGKIMATESEKLINSEADLVVVGANSVLANRHVKSGFRIIPKWLKMWMPTKEDPYSWFSSFGKHSRSYFNRKIHKIEAANYQCEITHDPKIFNHFYQHMYKPYSLNRFNEDAVIYGPEVLEKFFDKGFLILSKKNDEPAAAVIVHAKDGIMHLPFGGVANGDGELVKEGAMFAIHYYLTERAHSWGYSHIDFGRCRAFLSDGSLEYKLHWHCEPMLCDDVTSVFAIATPNNTPQGMKFLQEQPHFYLENGKCLRSDE